MSIGRRLDRRTDEGAAERACHGHRPRHLPLEDAMQSGLHRESRWLARIGYGVFVLSACFLLFDSVGKLLVLEPCVHGSEHLGYQRHHVFWLGVLEAAFTVLYIVPRTSLLGTILLTAFLGGATASHLRIDEPFVSPVAAGVIVWATTLFRAHEAVNMARSFVAWD